jgi:hypothetical protein
VVKKNGAGADQAISQHPLFIVEFKQILFKIDPFSFIDEDNTNLRSMPDQALHVRGRARGQCKGR